MLNGNLKGLQGRFAADLVEMEQQIKLWSSKAAELQPNIVAFAFALSVDASQIVFKGDLIWINAPAGGNSALRLPALDLAAIRKIVCNLKILHAQREQLEARMREPIRTCQRLKELSMPEVKKGARVAPRQSGVFEFTGSAR
jgi:hypothetical protein